MPELTIYFSIANGHFSSGEEAVRRRRHSAPDLDYNSALPAKASTWTREPHGAPTLAVMPVSLKTPEEIEKMRVAGRLAAEVLDYIGPLIRAGMTTDAIDRLCHEYMVQQQGSTPAPLNYAPPGYSPYPKSICTSVNHVVCHGVPGERVENMDEFNHALAHGQAEPGPYLVEVML